MAAMKIPFDPTEVIPELIGQGIDGLGGRLVTRFVQVWDSKEGRHLVGFIRSVMTEERAAVMMREFFTHVVVRRVLSLLELNEPQRRASLVASQLFGLAMIRYVLKVEPLASASVDDLARWIGPNVQRYFTADLGRARESASKADQTRRVQKEAR